MVLFDKCCCFFSLRTGAVILGWLGVVSYLFECVISMITFFHIDTIVKNSTIPDHMNVDDFKMRIEITIGCMFVLGLINLIAAALLIVGAVRDNRFLLVPWIIGGSTQIVFGFIIIISAMGITHAYPITYCALIVYLIIELYLWLCVVSLFRHLGATVTYGPSSSLLFNKPNTSNQNYYQAI